MSPHAAARLLTVAKVAELLRVSRATVYRLCAAGALSHARRSNGIRFTPEVVVDFIRRGRPPSSST